MVAEVILAGIIGGALVYVHVKPGEGYDKFCLWKMGVSAYNYFKNPAKNKPDQKDIP